MKLRFWLLRKLSVYLEPFSCSFIITSPRQRVPMRWLTCLLSIEYTGIFRVLVCCCNWLLLWVVCSFMCLFLFSFCCLLSVQCSFSSSLNTDFVSVLFFLYLFVFVPKKKKMRKSLFSTGNQLELTRSSHVTGWTCISVSV